jgi:maltooligosyltrehalose trehalohydrolase
VLRFFAAESAGDAAAATADGERSRGDRLLVLNLGTDLRLAPEPLLAPPVDMRWAVLWSSEDPRYGGNGMPPLETEAHWYIPGHAAVVLAPTPDTEGDTAANE